MSFNNDILDSIGRTPLIKIKHLSSSRTGTIVLGKQEGRNPVYSVKCRIGAGMIWDAEKRGRLKPGMEIIEPTSGNTGIALAAMGSARSYKVTLTMPESMSIERRKILAALGADVHLTAANKGMPGAIDEAQQLVTEDPERFFMPQQFKNPANPGIHAKTTGPEIWNDTEGEVDVIVAGVGTGGTITGISRYLKKTQGKNIVSVAVEPEESPVMTQKKAGKELVSGPHSIQGIGAGFIPDILDLSLIDRIEQVNSDEAVETTRRLAREEGLLCGISCGAALAAATRLVKEPEFEGKNIVVILPDIGDRYLSTNLFESC
ncbi:MAG: cysteine synthase A [Lentisphaeria bacterium]